MKWHSRLSEFFKDAPCSYLPTSGADRSHAKEGSHQFQAAFTHGLKHGYNTQTLRYWKNLKIIGVSLEGGTNHYM